MTGSVRTGALTLAAVVLLGAAPPALAAPPANDDRADAVRLSPPDGVTGTVVEATLENAEPPSGCADTDASVWYDFKASPRGAVIVQFDADGDLDATIDVYERSRSQRLFLDCDVSDRRGSATLELDDLDPGGDYAIRVGKLTNAEADSFRLRVLVPSPPARPPGRPLRPAGTRDSVDRLVNPSDAFSVGLRAGQTMRLSLAADQCTRLAVYAPGTRSFDGPPERALPCGGYRLFTPTRTGRHVLLVEAGRQRERQPYRLQVGRAGADDTTPGVFIRNRARVRGRVNGRLDSVDLYRFDVLRRSALALSVSGGPELTLVRANGRRLEERTPSVRRTVRGGRYFVAVRGRGAYRLRRVSRTLTSSALRFNGRRRSSTAPGVTSSLALGVRPGVSGRARITVERFDPIDGWQFLRRYRVRVLGGLARVAFTPPSVGRYRARASFLGSPTANPSETGKAKLVVKGPLVE